MGREPTKEGTKVISNPDHMGDVDEREGLENRTNMNPIVPTQNTMLDSSNMSFKEGCDYESIINNRNDPNNLKAFNENPFTKPLNSF